MSIPTGRFQFGPLDQGWWPDGLYTAPTDEALVYDIQKTKYLGFNMIRKHIKVEPARWLFSSKRTIPLASRFVEYLRIAA